MEELKATMLSVRYRNAERNWLVARMKTESKEVFIATGDIPFSETEEPVQLYGDWIEDKSYGRQFKVTTAHRILPTTVSGLKGYLIASEDIKGIGPVRANKLAEFFGEKLLHTLDTSPELLSTCPGINDELAKRITQGWRKDSETRRLGLFLAKHGLSARLARRILKQWNSTESIERITKNPYSLTEIEGIGFLTADEIASTIGFEKKDSVERINAACKHIASELVQQGNVFTYEHQLINEVVKLIAPRTKDTSKIRETISSVITAAIANKELIEEEVSDGISQLRLLYLPYLYKAEKSLAERIVEINTTDHNTPKNLDLVLQKVQRDQHVTFSTKQLEAIRGAFNNHIVVITGGPGTGKSTCVKAICEAAGQLGLGYACCAPTGRAAKRLSEITGRSATTIHRLLKWGKDGPQRGRHNPIECDVLIVDEASMLDLELGHKLLESIPTQCSVVFIGDTDQLPAIGAGTTLRDIIRSGAVPVITLDTVFRQAEQSLIIRNSHLIKRGEMPRFPETKGTNENSYVMWIPTNPNPKEGGKDDAEWVKKKLAQLVTKNIPEKFKSINPIQDIQVLTPMKKYTLGTYELNKVLQEALNPNASILFGGRFKVGDRVIQTRNNYDEGMEIYNGDIGFIKEDRPEDKLVVIDFYGRSVLYNYTSFEDLQLAYAKTIHKSQGSEYPIVIVIMGYQHWPMLERNLLYTANTRAKDMCLFMASKGAIERAVKNNPVHQRNTFLAQRIKALSLKDTNV